MSSADNAAVKLAIQVLNARPVTYTSRALYAIQMDRCIIENIDIPQWTTDGAKATQAKPNRSKMATFLGAAMAELSSPSEAWESMPIQR
jgi:hypothetical protein